MKSTTSPRGFISTTHSASEMADSEDAKRRHWQKS